MLTEPKIIQGGMGIAVSSWPLARAVSLRGQLGVVSGTALDAVFVRRLQLGDPGGHLRRALDRFPVPGIAERILDRYFVEGGKQAGAPFKSKPIPGVRMAKPLVELIVVANFAEVLLAKEGHEGVVGINLLEKIQLPNPASLFGAMLAGVDYVLMGAGIPRAIPGILDKLSQFEPVNMKLDVDGAGAGDEFCVSFDPRPFQPSGVDSLKRPKFLAIVSSATLAQSLVRKGSGMVDGFVVELNSAGGHNAPPRGPLQLDEEGEPVYGPRDVPDLQEMRALGRPFWLAGSFADPSKLSEAIENGAAGIQVGTAFAFCEESGVDALIKSRVLERARSGVADVRTDPFASPTGFPFKVVGLEGSLSDGQVYESRCRLCDLGYLRQLYRTAEGKVGYRCPAEPLTDFVAKGGTESDTVGRKCICNGLMTTAGFGQVRKDGSLEPAIVTAGDDIAALGRLMKDGHDSYGAADVLDYLLGLS
jgi:NAD(P)H-dependent flavin oxidoreductase YrpB (nitropropane dioxygenase family)